MWSCITLHNRPQVCFTPDLQPEWLLALICIFIGCICITTTVILLISSHFDRNVIPYARWVGFAASKYLTYSSKVSCSVATSLYQSPPCRVALSGSKVETKTRTPKSSDFEAWNSDILNHFCSVLI